MDLPAVLSFPGLVWQHPRLSSANRKPQIIHLDQVLKAQPIAVSEDVLQCDVMERHAKLGLWSRHYCYYEILNK